MPTSPTNTWEPSHRLIPIYNEEDAEQQNVTLAASLTLAKGTVLGELVGANAVFSLTQTGSPTAGTFTLTYGGQITGAIAYNATAATIQAALEALSSIGSGNVACVGGPVNTTAVTITFQNALGFQAITAPTHTDSLTGGVAPAMAVATTNAGSAGTKGTFKAYTYNAADGSQLPRGFLAYDVTTDGSGNVTLTGEWGATVKAAPMFMRGYFNCADLIGLDQNAITLLGGSLVQGTVSAGIVRIG